MTTDFDENAVREKNSIICSDCNETHTFFKHKGRQPKLCLDCRRQRAVDCTKRYRERKRLDTIPVPTPADTGNGEI